MLIEEKCCAVAQGFVSPNCYLTTWLVTNAADAYDSAAEFQGKWIHLGHSVTKKGATLFLCKIKHLKYLENKVNSS